LLALLKNDDLGKLILRLTLGGLILFHGVAKLGNPGSLDFIGGQLTQHGLPGFIAYGVFIGEVIAPLLLIGGLYTRIGALLVVANMLFAIGLVHMHQLFTLGKQGGWALELQGFFLLSAVVVALLGSGRFAIRRD